MEKFKITFTANDKRQPAFWGLPLLEQVACNLPVNGISEQNDPTQKAISQILLRRTENLKQNFPSSDQQVSHDVFPCFVKTNFSLKHNFASIIRYLISFDYG